MAKVKRMVHACPKCGEREHGKGTGLVGTEETNEKGKTLLTCTACGWTGVKTECVATEKVEDQQ
jgi:predicted RNA-binding Zn-ribbon protein involved in translation (DUF1610 family)